jgi:hypothetical protein
LNISKDQVGQKLNEDLKLIARSDTIIMPRLWFDKGTLLLKGEIGTPYGKWDPRNGCYRIKASHYKDTVEYLKESRIHYEDNALNLPPMEQDKK